MGLFRKKKKSVAIQPAAHDNGALVPSAEYRPRAGKQQESEEVLRDPYYEKLTSIARVLRYIATILLLVFGLGMAFFFSEDITAENLKLLLRNASFSFPGEQAAFTTVRYDADPAMDFAAYKEYFAVATTTGLRLYDHRGNIALDSDHSMKSPTVDAGKDYILVYDREGRSYVICNSVTSLYSGSEEHTIYWADVCDDGSYMVLTGSSTHLSVIEIYNRSFKLKRKMNVDRYPLCARLSDDGTKLLLLTCTADEKGRAEGCITFYDLSGKTEQLCDVITDRIPIYGCISDKGAAVLFEDGIGFYDSEGKEIVFSSFDGMTPCLYSESGGCLTVSFERDRVLRENRIRTYDYENVKLRGEFDYTGRISALDAVGELIFVGESDRTSVHNIDTGEEQVLLLSPAEEIFAGAGDAVFFCYRNKAENMRDKIKVASPAENGTEESAG